MNQSDKNFLKFAVVVITLAFSIGGPIMYEYSHVWSETGTISWVGPKFYQDGLQPGFAQPYAVTVPVHGTFNFTANGRTTFCGSTSSQILPMIKGTVVALIKVQCGGYDLVVDP